MNRSIYIMIFVLVVLVVIFSYKTRNYRLTLLPEAVESNTTDTKPKEIEVVNKPIVLDSQRKFLMALYREKHTGDCDHEKDGLEACITIKPKIIVLHMTDLETLETSFEYMREPVLREERDKLLSKSFDRVNVSVHFLIDRDGTIYSLMPENYMARHAIGVNHLAIGVENVGMNHTGPTREQVDSNIKLVHYLMKKYNISSKNVYSHAEVGDLKEKNSSFFVEKNEDYFMPKYCGQKVIKEVRRRL